VFELNPAALLLLLIGTSIYSYSLFILLRKRPINRARKFFASIVFLAFLINIMSFIRMSVLDPNVALFVTKLVMSLAQLSMFLFIMCPVSLLKPRLERSKILYSSIPFVVMIVLIWTTNPIKLTRMDYDWTLEFQNIVASAHAVMLTITIFFATLLFLYAYREVPSFRHKIRYLIMGSLIFIVLFLSSLLIMVPLDEFGLAISPVIGAITVFVFSLAFVDL
jgi:hypothetical protein